MAAVRAAIDKVNEVKKSDDVAAINRAVDELQRASQAMAEHLYAGPKSGAGPGAGPGDGHHPAAASTVACSRAQARGYHRRRVRREEVKR